MTHQGPALQNGLTNPHSNSPVNSHLAKWALTVEHRRLIFSVLDKVIFNNSALLFRPRSVFILAD